MKTITFYSPKSRGNTTVCVNVALQKKQLRPQKSVAIIQIDQYPDMDMHVGAEAKRDLLSFKEFHKTEEWNQLLLSTLSESIGGVDFFYSPLDGGIEKLDLSCLRDLWLLLEDRYDYVFIDLGRSISTIVEDFVLRKSSKVISVGSISPLELRVMNNFIDQNKDLFKAQFIINQCQKHDNKKVFKLGIPILGTLPVDEKNIWYQVYEGIPCAVQKSSPLRKQLLTITDNI